MQGTPASATSRAKAAAGSPASTKRLGRVPSSEGPSSHPLDGSPARRTRARTAASRGKGGFLGFNFDLKDQLVFYGSYHSNPINQLIHFIFVPALWWTAAVWLAYTPPAFKLDVAPLVPACCAHLARWLLPNGSFFLAALYSLYYLALEPLAGGSWAVLVALPLWGLANWFRVVVPSAWAWALGLHLFSWFAQIVFGHSMAERRRPALLDSFFQSLVLAPLFVWFELLWRLGYRRKLRSQVESRVARSISDWRAGSGHTD